MKLYNDKETLHRLWKLQSTAFANGGDNRLSWSEEYVDNIFLNRFCNIRVLDASVFYAKDLGYNNPEMHTYLKEEIINLLPSIVVELIGEQKTVHTTVSDVMYNKYFEPQKYRTGWLVCGDIGVGLYLLGYWYYPFALFIYILTFMYLCTLTRFNKRLIIPLPVMASFLSYFMYFDNAYGIFSSISLLMRGWVTVMMYCIFARISRLLLR